MFPSLGIQETFVIMVVILLLFGAKRLPDLAKGLGKTIREVRKAAEDVRKEIDITDDN